MIHTRLVHYILNFFPLKLSQLLRSLVSVRECFSEKILKRTLILIKTFYFTFEKVDEDYYFFFKMCNVVLPTLSNTSVLVKLSIRCCYAYSKVHVMLHNLELLVEALCPSIEALPFYSKPSLKLKILLSSKESVKYL